MCCHQFQTELTLPLCKKGISWYSSAAVTAPFLERKEKMHSDSSLFFGVNPHLIPTGTIHKFQSLHFAALETFWLIAYVLTISKPTILVNATSPAVWHFLGNCIKSHLIFAILFKRPQTFHHTMLSSRFKRYSDSQISKSVPVWSRRCTVLQSTLQQLQAAPLQP